MSTKNNPNGNSTVALVRSSREDATQISDSEVRQMVRDAVELAGGLSDIIEDGQFVVIKPNLVTPRAPTRVLGALTMGRVDPYAHHAYLSTEIPQKVNGITTDWRVAKAMVELVREVNPSGKVYVMECSCEGEVSRTFEVMGYTHENIPGVDRFIGLDETGDDFRAVDSEDLVAVDLKDRQQCKKMPDFLKNKYYFDKTYYDADVVISLCCLKNHLQAAMTGGIKNVGIGATPGKIYGAGRDNLMRMAINHGWEPLNDFIHDYYMAKPVQFVLTDGLQGLAYGPAGQGAPSYEGAKMNMRLILASKDSVAIDTVHSYIVGVDAEKVPCLRDLATDGFGTIDSSRITVVGNARVDEVKKPFPFPGGIFRRLMPEPSQTSYTDYEAPEISIEDIALQEDLVKVKVNTSPKTTKVEMYFDGRLLKTFTERFDELQYVPRRGLSGVERGSHKVVFYAYDRFLNCGHQTVMLVIP